MKKTLAFLLALSLCLTLTACGGTQAETTAEATTTESTAEITTDNVVAENEPAGICIDEIAMVEIADYLDGEKARTDDLQIKDYSFEIDHTLDIVFSVEQFAVGVDYKILPVNADAYKTWGGETDNEGWVHLFRFFIIEKAGDRYEVSSLSTGIFHKPYEAETEEAATIS